jgi:hypothetical protein
MGKHSSEPSMSREEATSIRTRLKAPRATAIAGILFSALLIAFPRPLQGNSQVVGDPALKRRAEPLSPSGARSWCNVTRRPSHLGMAYVETTKLSRLVSWVRTMAFRLTRCILLQSQGLGL